MRELSTLPRFPGRPGFLLLLCILATLCLLWACSKDEGKEAGGAQSGGPKGPPPVNVLTTQVQELPYAAAIELSGEMRSSQRVMLASEVKGRISAVNARVGDSVAAGSSFISIDPAEYSARLEIARSAEEQARLALAEARNGPRPEEIAEQRAALEQAEAALADAEDRLARLEQLKANDVVSESEIVSARNARDEARAAVDEEQRVLDRLQAGTRSEQLEAAESVLDGAVHARELAELDLQRCSIRAQFPASLTTLLVEVGQYVNAGTPLAELVSTGPAEAWFNLPEEERDRIGDGTAVELRSAAIPGEVFSGHVAGISQAADPQTRQFPLRVATEELRLLPGMSVTARLLLEEPQPRLLFSQDAAYESRLGLVVFRMLPAAEGEAPGFESIPVKLGERLDGLVLLEEGPLRAGDVLVTRGKESLFEGAKLKISDNAGPGGAGGGEAAQ